MTGSWTGRHIQRLRSMKIDRQTSTSQIQNEQGKRKTYIKIDKTCKIRQIDSTNLDKQIKRQTGGQIQKQTDRQIK